MDPDALLRRRRLASGLHGRISLARLGLVSRTRKQLPEPEFRSIQVIQAKVARRQVEDGRLGHDGWIKRGRAVESPGSAQLHKVLQKCGGILEILGLERSLCQLPKEWRTQREPTQY